jgi:hypothetical protein
MAQSRKPAGRARPPRIRVPNHEKVLFSLQGQNFVGVLHRLSLTGGSAVLPKGPIPAGTLADLAISTVFGKVTAKVEFLNTGADGIRPAQAFRFVSMNDTSGHRLAEAIKQMEEAGFSDAEPDAESTIGGLASQSLGRLWGGIRDLSANLASATARPPARRK